MTRITWSQLLIMLVAGLVLAGRASAQVTMFADVPYDAIPGIDPNLLSLDIYVPDGADGTNPVMIVYHGSSFVGGDKTTPDLVHPKMDYYTSLGWVFLSVNYRLTNVDLPADSPDQVTHPDHVEDAARSIAWTIENISAYGGNPDRIVLMGFSAGAQLVALVATDETRLEAEGYSLSRLDGVIALDGMYDVPFRNQQIPLPPAHMELVWGTGLATQQDMSPTLHVDAGECIPPMLVVHQDEINHTEQSTFFVDALVAAGFSAAAYDAAGLTHQQIGGNVGIVGDPLTIEVDAFLAGLSSNADACAAAVVPAVSTRGLVVMAMLVLGLGTAILRGRWSRSA